MNTKIFKCVAEINLNTQEIQEMDHQKESKSRLTQKKTPEKNGKLAEKRMNACSGRLAKHGETCPNEIQ